MASKITFITIGYIEWRKGQDLLISAIEQLPKEILDLAEFHLIGQNTSLLAQSLAERITGIENVSMPGTVSREGIHRHLETADVMICPSREDPMPTVCAEAMMYRMPCLVSDVTGTAVYINDGYDGLIFQSENVDALKEKIIWSIKHRIELKEMGNRAFEIYKKVFSEESFVQNLLMYVEEMIGKAKTD